MEEESGIIELVELLAEVVGYVGVGFIAIGALLAVAKYLATWAGRATMSDVRIVVGKYILIGMEFMVGQDVVETVLYTDAAHLKSLAITVVIRTVLEHFLGKEVEELEAERDGGHHAEAKPEGEEKSPSSLLGNMRLLLISAMVIGLAALGLGHIISPANAESGEEADGLEMLSEPGEGEEAEAEESRERHDETGEVDETTDRGSEELDQDGMPRDLRRSLAAAQRLIYRSIDRAGRTPAKLRVSGRRARSTRSDDVQVEVVRALSRSHALLGDERAKRAAIRATRYLARDVGDSSLAPGGEDEDEAASRPRNVALVLLAFLAARSVDEERVSVDLLRHFGDSVARLQLESGRFRSVGSGQAVLALVRLFRIDADPRWLEAALSGMAYIVGSRAESRNSWSLSAAASLLEAPPADTDRRISEEALREYATRVARELLSAGPPMRESCVGRPPAGVGVLDSLIELSELLPADSSLRLELRETTEDTIEWLVRCQLRNGRARGGWVRNDLGSTVVDMRDVSSGVIALASYARMSRSESD